MSEAGRAAAVGAILRQKPLFAYGMAVALSTAAVAVRWASLPYFSGLRYVLLLPAVVVAAWLVGLGPGLLAVALTAAGAVYFLFPPYYSFQFETSGQLIGLGLYVAVAAFLAGLTHWLTETRNQNIALLAEQDSLVRRQAELLREKDLLMRELHHRVKNQVQMATALLRLQARRAGHAATAAALEEAAQRLMTLTRVYERLQVSGSGDIDVGEYLDRVCRDTVEGMAGDRVAIAVEAESLTLATERAFSVALIANELVSNAVKHGFPDDAAGRIDAALKRIDGERVEMSVIDNGRGVPEGFDLAQASGLGSKIVLGLVDSMAGSLIHTRDRGTGFVVTFSSTGASADRASHPQ